MKLSSPTSTIILKVLLNRKTTAIFQEYMKQAIKNYF